MMFIWLLVSPILSIITDFLKPIAAIGIAIFLDFALGIGITQSIIDMAMQWLQTYVENNAGDFINV